MFWLEVILLILNTIVFILLVYSFKSINYGKLVELQIRDSLPTYRSDKQEECGIGE